MSSSPADSCLLFCLQLRLSPTLLSSYDPYDDTIFMFMTHAQDYRHPTTITTLRPSSPSSTLPSGRYPLGGPTTLFGRSSLGGGRLSSIRSGSFSLPFVFGLGDIPRRTRLPLKISAYSHLPDLPRLEPSPIVYGRQPQLRPIRPSWWLSGISHFLLLFLLSGLSRLWWSPVIIGCQLYP